MTGVRRRGAVGKGALREPERKGRKACLPNAWLKNAWQATSDGTEGHARTGNGSEMQAHRHDGVAPEFVEEGRRRQGGKGACRQRKREESARAGKRGGRIRGRT